MGGAEANEEKEKQVEVLMCGYFPGVTSQRPPLSSPAIVRLPEAEMDGDSWNDVCAGGCGFGMAVSASGKLITWGSADDQGQSYLTSGKHGENPEKFHVPTTDRIVKAAAGWAHCISVTDKGQVYSWGWKECVPSGKVTRNWSNIKSCEEDENCAKQSSTTNEQDSPRSQSPKSTGLISFPNDKLPGIEAMKRRKVTPQQELDASIPADEILSMPPCLVELDSGVKITSVAAGGRHTLALSELTLLPDLDVGQVWGWGYGGEGQLGLGSRIKTVASPHLIPCIESSTNGQESSDVSQQSLASEGKKFIGNYVKGIACGGRHSVVVTDAGVLLAFGWGLYGQCGQGNTDDLLKPYCVPSLMGTRIEAVAAGLWHTICICADGRVHVFGGNQFGQLGLGTNSDQCELVPRLVNEPILDGKKAKVVSCGARHSAILTGKPSVVVLEISF
ncbi:regulator of chromosome condensation family protein [Striga asiatica]|uniref:Regulator of chromosome condensation family protein n=1 Tax=Striga asiatica TaxID=4170 RepID=A0A5A7QQ82_STRAF|nr:regulator of chromosome condensation family protein [Striga asiatica]